MAELQWYAVRIIPQQRAVRTRAYERPPFAVEHFLSVAGFETFLPVNSLYRRRSKYTKAKELKRYPLLVGWIFVGWERGANRWRDLFDTRGVLGVAGLSGRPFVIPQARIDELREIWRDKNFVAPKREKFMRTYKEYAPGDDVRLTEGSFDGMEGRVIDVKGSKARVLLNLLGTEREVGVEAYALEPVEKKEAA